MVSSVNSMGAMSSAYISQVPGKQQRNGEDLFEKIDTNSDESVSADEFISNRPEDVTEDQAKQLWSMLDASNNGSLTRSQFVSAMESQPPPPGPPPAGGSSDIASATDSSASSNDAVSASDELMEALLAAIKQYSSTVGQNDSAASDDTDPSLSDLFNKIDTNGDGVVSAEEFISNRPEDVNEDQAKEMWRQLDTENSGSLTESQFTLSMEKPGPPPGPPPMGGKTPDDTNISAVTELSASSKVTGTAADELVNALLTAIKQYTSTMGQNGFSSANSLTSNGLLSTVV
ncbi:MAG: EF-hand domain-containing protein [Pseudomonadota bacterium]